MIPAFVLHLLAAFPLCARAAEAEVQPPFGLAWDEPALALEESLMGGSGRIVERKKTRGGESWYVEGLPQAALQRAVFHLHANRLGGVELQYGKDDWTPETYDAFMQSVKTRLEAKHGPGVLIARKQETERGLLQTLLGYRWEQPSGSIELVYFAAQNPANLFRSVSLHYAAAVAPAAAVSSAPPLPPLPVK